MAEIYLSDNWLNIANTPLVLIKKNVFFHSNFRDNQAKYSAQICRANPCKGSLRTYMSR